MVSPDAGGVERARAFAKKLDAPLAIVDKRRVDMDVSEVMHLIGDVRGRTTLIVDDIIDTAGTLVKTADALLREGATQVYAACTHAVLSGPAVERIEKSNIKEVVATDSVPLSEAAQKDGEDQGAERRGFARARHSLDSRRDLDQRALYLNEPAVACTGRISGRKEAMAQIIVQGAPRTTRGKNEARRLRVAGKVPAVLYGGKGEAQSLSVNTKQVRRHPAFGDRPQHAFPGGI